MIDRLCNCIALYDYDGEKVDLKGWFQYMEYWAQEIGQPWESAGITTSAKLIQFKNAKKKMEKNSFEGIIDIELLGGVLKPGTNTDWKTYTEISAKNREGLKETTSLCFSNKLSPFSKEMLKKYSQELLKFGDFKYGIGYQRDFYKGPSAYAAGVIGTYGNTEISEQEEDQIAAWMHQYDFRNGKYRLGLLRDVYPFNILITAHLEEKVGSQTLESWIKSHETRGTLEPLNDTHWLWSVDPAHIPAAQETLHQAGLLLCYKP